MNPPTPDRPQWTCLGDQTEAALRVLAMKGGLNEQAMAFDYPRIHELPFDAKRKRMTHDPSPRTGRRSPSSKARRAKCCNCARMFRINGEVIELTDELRAEIMAANDDYARNALRVLAMAFRELPARSGPRELHTRIRRAQSDLLGLAAMMDPPRPEVAEAIKKFHEAGIRLAMITGDYGLTAESVARRIGLLNTPVPPILTGAELDALDR